MGAVAPGVSAEPPTHTPHTLRTAKSRCPPVATATTRVLFSRSPSSCTARPRAAASRWSGRSSAPARSPMSTSPSSPRTRSGPYTSPPRPATRRWRRRSSAPGRASTAATGTGGPRCIWRRVSARLRCGAVVMVMASFVFFARACHFGDMGCSAELKACDESSRTLDMGAKL